MKAHLLAPWRSGGLTLSRSVGELGLNKNGSYLDIWIRIGGRAQWFAINLDQTRRFLDSVDDEVVLVAESDGNAE